MSENYRLTGKDVDRLLEFSKEPGFPCRLAREVAELYCKGGMIKSPCVQTYGIFEGDRLVSVMTATYAFVFPHEDSPGGRICHISGTFTSDEFRHKGYATALLKSIERDARGWNADYLCCDSSADGFDKNSGFIGAPENESRLWKPL